MFIEAALFDRRRWWGNGRSWAAVAVGGALVAAALWRQPGYLSIMVPLARATYGGWDIPLFQQLMTEGGLSSAVTLWLAFRIPASAGRCRPRLLLAAAVAAGLVTALSQRKGYDYHFLPAIIPAVPLLMLMIADALKAWHADDAHGRTHARFGLVLAMLVGLWDGNRFLRDALWPFDYHTTAARMAPLVAELGGGRPVAVLSIHNFPAFPTLIRYGGEWALRYPSLWPLVGYYRGGAIVPPGPQIQALRRMVTEDLEAKAPCLVMVDTWGWGQVRYPFIDFLSAEPRFAALWQNYRLAERIDGYDIYTRCDISRHSP